MTYTARKLITDAYYLSGIIARSFQTIDGEELNDGINALNDLLAAKSFDNRLIPYYKEYDFNAVIGQEKYFVPNLIEVESFTFNLGNVRFQTINVGRIDYFGTARLDNISSLPFKWHAERTNGGMNIYMYFFPADTYALKLWGKFGFDQVDENTDLLLTFDKFYTYFLKYELASYLCDIYNFPFQAESQLLAIRKRIKNISPVDFTMQKKSMFDYSPAMNWGDVNIGRGWRP